MPSPSQIKKIVSAVLRQSPEAVFYIESKPGMGKSQVCDQIAVDILTDLGVAVPEERMLSVNLSNFDVVELGGVPEIETKGDVRQTVFRPTDLFYQFRDGTGPGVIRIEELAQATNHHHTWFAGFSLDRRTASFKLDPQVRVIANGNRTEDKAGARQLLSHLNNRMYIMEMETSLDDYCEWALANNVPIWGIAYLRLRPDILNDFDPNRKSNPTQRSWTQLFQEVPFSLPTDLYLYAAEGKVGEGAAADWVAAKDMMDKMPSIDAIRMHPDSYEIPPDPVVRYAVATAMSTTTTPDAFDRDMVYITRMKKEFQMVFVTDSINKYPKIQQSKAFIDWAIANKDIFMGGN